MIDKKEIGNYSDYNEGFDSLTTLYTDKCMIELQASSHIYVTNIHTNVLLDEEGNKDAIDSTVIRTAYYNYNGNRFNNRTIKIDRDYKGRIKRIGRNYIRYDFKGNVTKTH